MRVVAPRFRYRRLRYLTACQCEVSRSLHRLKRVLKPRAFTAVPGSLTTTAGFSMDVSSTLLRCFTSRCVMSLLLQDDTHCSNVVVAMLSRMSFVVQTAQAYVTLVLDEVHLQREAFGLHNNDVSRARPQSIYLTHLVLFGAT
jgi:hypothetical protein